MPRRVEPFYRSFTGGEVDPRFDGLLDGITQGCRTLENFVVRSTGGVERRPGTIYAGAAASDSKYSRLFPFTNAAGTSYVLEFSDLTLKVWKQSTHAVVATVTTPYDDDDVFKLKLTAIGDHLYIVHPSYDPMILFWAADASWGLRVADWYAGQKLVTGYQVHAVMAVSDDAISWQNVALPTPTGVTTAMVQGCVSGDGTTIIYGYDLAPAAYETAIWYADEKFVWRAVNVSAWNKAINNMAFGNGVFLCGTFNATAAAVYKSSDKGRTWAAIAGYPYGTENAYVWFDPVNTRFITSDGAGHWRTTADGTTWSDEIAATHLETLIFHDAVIIGVENVTSSIIRKSTNGGATWTSVYTPASNYYHQPYVVWINNRYVVAGYYDTNPGSGPYVPCVSVSDDDGATWTTWKTQIAASATGRPYGLIAMDEVLYMVLENGQWWVSYDFGTTWVHFSTVSDQIAAATAMWPPAFVLGQLVFSSEERRPRAIGYVEQRIAVAGSAKEPDKLWATKTRSVNNFTLGYRANDGLEYQFASRRNASILWMEAINRGLCVGARESVGFLVGNESAGITPSSAQFQWLFPHGSADVQGIQVGQQVFYAQRGGEVLRAFPSDANLTLLSGHITRGGVVQFDYMDDPMPLFFAVRSDGVLVVGSVMSEGISWSRWKTRAGDLIESIAVVPNATTKEDEIWLCVKRTIGESAKRFIEYAKPFYFAEKQDCHFLDSGVFYTSTLTSTITGLTHLVGESVKVLISGNVVETATVAAGGSISLATPGSQVHAGLAYTSKLQTCRLGTGMGMIVNRRAIGARLWLYQTIGGKVGVTSTTTESRSYTSATELETDLVESDIPGKWDDDSYIWVLQEDPLPMTVMALSASMIAGDQ